MAASLVPLSARAEFGDFRALWVSRFEYNMSGPAGVQQVMANAASMGITDVVFQVRGTADAYYNSNYEPRSHRLQGSWDPLQTAITAAHAHGMKVHAWINTLPLWSGTEQPANQAHPFHNTNPSFRRMDSSGNLESPIASPTLPGTYALNGEYATVNPILPEVHTHINNVVRDIATNYAVDGVHLDYIRWGGNQNFATLPHDPQSHALFQQATGLNAANSANAAAYRTFIKNRITDLVGSLKSTIDQAEVTTGRKIDLSAAVWRDPDIGENERLQDYRTWLENDYLDIVMPMIYLNDANDHLMLPNLLNTLAIPSNARVAPGLGVYLHGDPQLTVTQLQRLYDNGADGATFFSYSNFFGSDPLAAQRRGLVQQFYSSIESPPAEEGDYNLGNHVLVDFEVDEGPFHRHPTFSGTTEGVLPSSTADRTTSMAHRGIASQVLDIKAEGSGPWLVRHLSGSGNPGDNEAFATDGFLGFWLKTTATGLSVAPVLDDPGTGDRGIARSIVADGEWHLYEWNLDDNSQWEAWVTGNGIIDGPMASLDSIQFFGIGDAVIYLDTVAHNPLGSLVIPRLEGDYNQDGVVNAADYTVWRNSLGETGNGLAADGNRDGTVNQLDYEMWRDNFGATRDGASLESPIQAVPEPRLIGALVACGLLISRVLKRTRANG